MRKRSVLPVVLLLLCNITTAIAAEVGLDDARAVAQNWLNHYTAAYKSWAGSSSPVLTMAEFLRCQGKIVGYNFLVLPRGHILVPSRDELPPVKLYSESVTISVDQRSEVFDWIAEELFKLDQALDEHAQEMMGIDFRNTANGRLWEVFKSSEQAFPQRFSKAAATMDFLTVGPSLATTWGQEEPYWQQTPLWTDGSHTSTGCVATAAAQIMKFWNYPATGKGSTSYVWNNGSTEVTLSRDFSSSTYDWANMLNSYSSGSTATQQAAVAKLMADVGIAFNMDYSPTASGTSTDSGLTAYPTYFKYKTTIQNVSSTDYASDSAWMQVFKAEAQAGRPSLMTIWPTTDEPGHAVVVDGYRDSPSEQIHLNVGWSGYYDGWYVSNNMVFHGTSWAAGQSAVIGIEPRGAAPPAPGYVFGRFWPQLQGQWYFSLPGKVVVDPNGNLIVADTQNNRIQVFNSSGMFLRKWGSYGSGCGQFNWPYGVAVDATGNVFVADIGNNRIQVFNSSGTLLRKWGSQGSGLWQRNAGETARKLHVSKKFRSAASSYSITMIPLF